MSTLEQLSKDMAGIAADVRPSVVAVHGRRGAPASGIVWGNDSEVVTTSHTLDREDGIEVVTASGERYPAKLAGYDSTTDIALLSAEGLDLPAPRWHDTSELQAGALGVVVSHRRVGLGLVAALGDAFDAPTGGRIDRSIELDTSRFRGFSGSLWLDASGRALGMSSTGIRRRRSMAIPTETLRRVVDSLRDHGGVARGYLGVTTYPIGLPKSASQSAGLLLLSVEPSSPADKAKLFLGDVLLSVDGRSVERPTSLLAYLSAERIGKNVELGVLRAGEETSVTVEVAARK